MIIYMSSNSLQYGPDAFSRPIVRNSAARTATNSLALYKAYAANQYTHQALARRYQLRRVS